ncbi:MAG: hypothetical protein U0289_11510 [Cyclobacteriaceae bacterium]|jgi:hypothetical protein|nr:hypothetical protein [Cytophagales bacterium]
MKLKLNAILLALLAVVGLWSCGSKGDQSKSADEFADAEKSLKEEIKDIAYTIPPPAEIPYMLQATGADFNQSLVNDRKKADSYGSQSDKAALNLGVYTADIGYLSSYDKTQESIDYLNACKNLADKLGVTGSFDRGTLEKFEANIANKDSLAALLNDAMQKTDRYLKDGNKSKLGALLVAGSFVESMYISTGLIKSYPKDILPDDKRNLILTPLMSVVIKQRKSVGEVAKMLASVDQTGPIPQIVADLNALEASYAALNLEDKIKSNKANLALSDKNLAEITKVVEKLRGDIVN